MMSGPMAHPLNALHIAQNAPCLHVCSAVKILSKPSTPIYQRSCLSAHKSYCLKEEKRMYLVKLQSIPFCFPYLNHMKRRCYLKYLFTCRIVRIIWEIALNPLITKNSYQVTTSVATFRFPFLPAFKFSSLIWKENMSCYFTNMCKIMNYVHIHVEDYLTAC